VAIDDWLTCFPAYVFLLCAPAGREDACMSAFHARGLAAAVVGVIDDSGEVTLTITAEEAQGLPVHDPPPSGEIVPEDASLLDRMRTGIEHLTGEDRTN